MDETMFEFDRPSQHGLSAPSVSDGSLTRPEAAEAILDRLRDMMLQHYDPAHEIGQMLEANDSSSAVLQGS